MNPPPDDFRDLRRLLALKRHEQPPPGYFERFPDRVVSRIEREQDLTAHSTWWEWLVEKLDAQPVFAGAYAFAISALMLMGLKVSQDMRHEPASEAGASGLLGAGLDPVAIQPGNAFQRHFVNPASYLYFSEFASTDAVFEEPQSGQAAKIFPARLLVSPAGD